MSVINDALLTSKILIVDDEPANVAVLEALLHGEGCTNLMSTGDPRDVVGLHQTHDFDIILLDIRMPHMSGIEVMEELGATLEEGDWLPVLVLTAQTDDETRFQALTAGARDFVNKPFKRWEVLLRIRNMLETRRLYKRQRLRADELEEIVQERTREVRETQLQIIERLGQAGEYRDEETGMHVMRMSHSCQMLALAAGLGAARAELILYATPMHDVGKIGIPDNILLKPGRHAPEERKIMETHVSIGAQIIGEHKSELLMMARNVALCHHEKWDGSGYPQGLKGEDIPIEARIAAICDVFDALTSSRPYKEAWPLEKAVALVKDQSGKHFDPMLVEVFLGILHEIVALREQFYEG
ncbi:Response regulator receiver modulated metal dependent phosphohydrolase [Magnetospirillum gryphiswaldense MSR-1 v2]|uniref:Response regulator receiver modulated metal dependent phosphohydrolase n=1 Tax=Magnetospirillum gryphiswaldense (strain DSM 6361 / JCM 21280 / NBRC 15271 / MSR-1) TaxID=431944 RepID=V6F469_MAGGM|nr:HD domain-containing phosphohydrolase [Magnetospirillum gryphiswaldense]CDL00300.1 Response regulator receiver modulated metal dependent phosphohydrolase [Magnetospirillum gryphiswaldense MSR-1 v2]